MKTTFYNNYLLFMQIVADQRKKLWWQKRQKQGVRTDGQLDRRTDGCTVGTDGLKDRQT